MVGVTCEMDEHRKNCNFAIARQLDQGVNDMGERSQQGRIDYWSRELERDDPNHV